MYVGKFLLDAARCLDEINRIVVVFCNASGDGKNIRIENDVFRRKSDFFRQQLVGIRANLEFPVCGIGLAFLIKSHDHDRRAIAQHFARLLKERLLAFLQADRIDDTLALHAFQARLDHRPF